MDLAGSPRPALTARAAGLIGCERCGKVAPMGQAACGRCGSPLNSRRPGSLQAVWAWLIAGIIVYIPANIYPMLYTNTLTSRHSGTIVGGIIDLIEYGSYFVAIVVFVASVLIPIGKFVVIGYLAFAVRARAVPARRRRAMHRMYEIVEFIGRWSMIDVFVVAILSALVQLGSVASIRPGIAAACFALSVAMTMLAARAFDPRLIWDLEPADG
ncbi:MAG: paraquat-inducible protein A [Pseudomonadota bacterium]